MACLLMAHTKVRAKKMVVARAQARQLGIDRRSPEGIRTGWLEDECDDVVRCVPAPQGAVKLVQEPCQVGDRARSRRLLPPGRETLWTPPRLKCPEGSVIRSPSWHDAGEATA